MDTTKLDDLTARDLFAAFALAGLLAFTMGGEGNTEQLDSGEAAEEAYAMADAMLKERTVEG